MAVRRCGSRHESRLFDEDIARYLDYRRDVLQDYLGAIRCMVDMVEEDSEHQLYNPYTGAYLMQSEDSDSEFYTALMCAKDPQEIVTEVSRWHYGLSH